jgi:hydrogenase expression/formation protein HypC
MCLAIPGRVVAIDGSDPMARVAVVEYSGVRRRAQLLYLPDATVGEFVIVQAGFAIRRMSEAEAREALEIAGASPAPPAKSSDLGPPGNVGTAPTVTS